MKSITITIDSETESLLDKYCEERITSRSHVIRQLVRRYLLQHEASESSTQDTQSNTASRSLHHIMVNEKRAIEASIQTLEILKSLANDSSMIEKAYRESAEIIDGGWRPTEG